MQLWLRLDRPDSAGADLALLDATEGTTLAQCLPMLAEARPYSERPRPGEGEGAGGPEGRGAATSLSFPRILDAPADSADVVPRRWYADGTELAPTALLGHPPLVHGVLLANRPSQTPTQSAPPATVQVRVISGHGAGDTHELPIGQHLIGRSVGCSVPVDDGAASRRHALLTVQSDQVTLADLGSTNGTWLGDQRLRVRPEPVGTHDVITIGPTRLAIRAADAQRSPAPDPVPRGDGTAAINRCPRTIPTTEPQHFRYPTAPQAPESRRPAAVTLVLPLLAAAVLAVVFRSPVYLCFGLLGPLMAVGQFWSERRAGLGTYRKRQSEYRRMITEVDARVAEALRADRRQREHAAPDLCEVVATARERGRRLWERSRQDPDVLLARLGTGPVVSEITIEDARPDTGAMSDPVARHPVLRNAPVCIRLTDGPTGIAGPRQLTLAVVRSLLSQVTVWHSPRDVRIWLLTDASATLGEWNWATLLPHTRPDAPPAGLPGTHAASERCGRPLARIGALDADSDQLPRRVQELGETLCDRLGASKSRLIGLSHPVSSPVDLVILDGARRLRAVPGVTDLLLKGSGAGIHLLCLAPDQGDLPAECTTTLRLSTRHDKPATLAHRDQGDVTALHPDLMTLATSLTVATALAPLRDETPDPADEGLPPTVNLGDIVDLPVRDGIDALAAAVRRGWDEQPASTRATLGVGTSGPHTVDLRTDGPHILVAGTTGAGKSELLRTLITALAVRNRPDRLCFVLVDYKGGAAFDACAALPHTVGLVTDLDQALTERALVSLEAELRRRERALRAAGVGDIDAYHAADRAEPLPRLVLVIDEFRVLSEELPDFVTGLVRIAALGRSLGVHLVLATQRPGGVVTPDIRANMNLRIALRVRDRTDSADVIEADDAAALSAMTPGRAVLRRGGGPLTLIQTALVSGSAAAPDDVLRPPVLHRLDPGHLGEPAPRQDPVRGPAAGPSDLTSLVTATQLAALRCLAVPPAPPWLPPLPSYLSVDDLAGYAPETEPDDPFSVPLGVLDLPDHQRQDRFAWDPTQAGHLFVVGSARSGRTTVARSATTGLAGRSCPCRLHAYVVDGTGGLADLSRLPHVGAIVRAGENALLRRLVARLHVEVEQRRHRPENDAAQVILVLDGWERIREQVEHLDHGETLNQLLAVLRDGPSAGISAILTGDRSLLTGAVAAFPGDRLILPVADPMDLALVGLRPRDQPDPPLPGRAYHPGRRAWLQVAVPAMDATATAAKAARDRPGHGDHGPGWRVEPLPAVITTSDIRRLDRREASVRRTRPAVGRGPDGDVVGLDLSQGGALVVGPPGSGRSTTLAIIAESLTETGRPVRFWGPDADPVGGRVGGPVDPAVFRPDSSSVDQRLADLARELDARPDTVVLVDDIDPASEGATDALLTRHIRASGRTGGAVVASCRAADAVLAFRGITGTLRRLGVGIVLHPRPQDDELFGVRIPRDEPLLPGRGVLVSGGSTHALQVAVPSPGPDTANTGRPARTGPRRLVTPASNSQ